MRQNEGYRRFREALLDGRIGLGQTLTQFELCEILGMSLSPLRETTALLQEEQLITVRKRAGVTVFTPDLAFFRDNYQMRTILEREAVRRFARNAPLDLLERLAARHQEALAQLRQSDNSREFASLMVSIEADFHFAMVAALGNPVVAEAHEKSYSNMRLSRLTFPCPPRSRSRSAGRGAHPRARSLPRAQYGRCL